MIHRTMKMIAVFIGFIVFLGLVILLQEKVFKMFIEEPFELLTVCSLIPEYLFYSVDVLPSLQK